MSSAKEYENYTGSLLEIYFASLDMVTVRIRRSLRFRSERSFRSYSPIIDISVGPFSETRGASLWGQYDSLADFSRDMIDEMLVQFRQNYQDFGHGFFRIEERTLPTSYQDFLSQSQGVNWNARCFLAIEVEDSGSPKHLLGDMINVSIAGRIGLVIGYNQPKYETLLRQLDYIAYSVEAKKIKFNSKNILVLKPDQFENAIVNNLPPESEDSH
jgi:hypothetical protein